MSKNFELLIRIAKDDVFSLPGEPARRPQRGTAAFPLKKDPPNTEITKLVRRLFLPAAEGTTPKAVSFSGITRDDRSGVICAQAGEALAEQVDTSVCIVDANLWSPQLQVPMTSGHHAGLAEAVAMNGPIRNFATPMYRDNLWLMPAGFMKPGYSIQIERYRERFAELRETFNYILISAPALSRESEATLMGQLADGIVLIVEAHNTRRDGLLRVKQELERAQVRLLGAVLDQRTFPIPEGLYRRL